MFSPLDPREREIGTLSRVLLGGLLRRVGRDQGQQEGQRPQGSLGRDVWSMGSTEATLEGEVWRMGIWGIRRRESGAARVGRGSADLKIASAWPFKGILAAKKNRKLGQIRAHPPGTP